MYGEILLVALLSHYAPTTEWVATPDIVLLSPAEQGVIRRTNEERRRHGLSPLSVDGRLIRSARRHTAWMTRNHSLQHTNIGVGENIAMGQHNSHEAVHAWMNSSGHRANILHSGYTKIGVAAYTANDGTVFWCQQFVR